MSSTTVSTCKYAWCASIDVDDPEHSEHDRLLDMVPATGEPEAFIGTDSGYTVPAVHTMLISWESKHPTVLLTIYKAAQFNETDGSNVHLAADEARRLGQTLMQAADLLDGEVQS